MANGCVLSATPLLGMFFNLSYNNFNNLGSGSPKDHYCQIIFKSAQWFLTKKIFFFKFSLYIHRENRSHPLDLVAMFFNGSITFEQSWVRVT